MAETQPRRARCALELAPKRAGSRLGRVGPQIIAHRGFSHAHPELTRSAFEAALAMPIDGIECDVRLTRDGQVVVFHDAVVDRTTDGQGRVNALDYAQLRELNAGTADKPQRVMLLAELLELMEDYPSKHIYIEVKHGGAGLPAAGALPAGWAPAARELDRQTLRVLRSRGMDASPRVHIISFSHATVGWFGRKAPQLETFSLLREWERRVNPAGLLLSRPDGIGPSIRHLQARPELVGKRGRTYTWTVNEPADMRWCRAHGVDVLATDRPDLAVTVLARGNAPGKPGNAPGEIG